MTTVQNDRRAPAPRQDARRSIVVLLIVAASPLRSGPDARGAGCRRAAAAGGRHAHAGRADRGSSRARRRWRSRPDRLTDPRGNNALEYFRAVLALQPDNADARTGLERVGAALEARVVEALQARNRGARRDCAHRLCSARCLIIRDSTRCEPNLLALSRSTRTPVSAAPPPAPVKQPPATDSPAPSARDAPAPIAATPRAASSAAAAQRRSPVQASSSAVARLRGRGILLEPPGNNAYEQLLALRAKYPDVERASHRAAAARIRVPGPHAHCTCGRRRGHGTRIPAAAWTRWSRTWTRPSRCRRSWQPRSSSATSASQIVQAKTLKRVREVRAQLSARSGAAGPLGLGRRGVHDRARRHHARPRRAQRAAAAHVRRGGRRCSEALALRAGDARRRCSPATRRSSDPLRIEVGRA